MKKVKVMLTAFAVVAIVGGALAFKAQKNAIVCYYSDNNSHPQLDCPLQGLGATVTSPDQAGFFATTSLPVAGVCVAVSCPDKATTTIE